MKILNTLTLHPTGEPSGALALNEVSYEDEAELVAVITAAITAYTGSGDFTIMNIVKSEGAKKVSNWVLSGRQEAFDRRRVIRK